MKCDRCDRQAVYSRKYSGQSHCSQCFSESIVRKTAKTISRYGMIQNDDLVAVAVSGGKDSLALLQMMHQMESAHNFRIRAVTVDEGIPGYRDEALGIVEDFCQKLGVKHTVYSYKDLFEITLEEALELRGENAKTSSCSICGTLRRRAIDAAARDIGADVVATGHNLDDTLQTFVINMLSGDAERIGWMDPEAQAAPPRRVKPFCEIYESEIVFYAFTNNLPFQSEPCPHMNEGIRTEIREFLNSLEAGHSGIKNNMYRSVLRVSRNMRDAGHKQMTTCQRCGNSCTGTVCSVCSTVAGLKGSKPNANIT